MKRIAIVAVVLAAIALVAAVRLFHRSDDGWQAVTFPQECKRDGNRANVVVMDRPNRLIALLATGVTWSPETSMVPSDGGWDVTVSAAGHAAKARLAGRGPALLVALDGKAAERFELDDAGFDALASALETAHTADPRAPLDSLSVVDVVRDHYAGPDRPRLLRTFAGYRTIVLSPPGLGLRAEEQWPPNQGHSGHRWRFGPEYYEKALAPTALREPWLRAIEPVGDWQEQPSGSRAGVPKALVGSVPPCGPDGTARRFRAAQLY